MLVVFFGLFIPLKVYQQRLLYWYVVFLVALHIYVLLVFLWRVKWRIFAENRKAFLVRVVAIVTFVFLLTLVRVGVTPAELALFVIVSGVIHLALLMSLTVDVRRELVAAES